MSHRGQPRPTHGLLRRVGTIAAVAAASLGTASGAFAASAPRPMPLGAAVAPPPGYVDFCRRQPADCGIDAATAERAGRTGSAWGGRFAAARMIPSALEAPGPETPRAEASPAASGMTPELRALAERVNREVNRAIVRRSDTATYGVADRWATPLAESRREGDCEDYVLEKRRALIAAGVPARDLNIALAQTPWGEAHAVLLLASSGGEYVLDNLEPWILPWDQSPYRWRSRQVGGDPLAWARVAAD